jgi:hypothetical protein
MAYITYLRFYPKFHPTFIFTWSAATLGHQSPHNILPLPMAMSYPATAALVARDQLTPSVPAAVGLGLGALGMGAAAMYNHWGDAPAADWTPTPVHQPDATDWKSTYYDQLSDPHKLDIATRVLHGLGDPTGQHLAHPVTVPQALAAADNQTSWLERRLAGSHITNAATQFGQLPPAEQNKLFDAIRQHSSSLPR